MRFVSGATKVIWMAGVLVLCTSCASASKEIPSTASRPVSGLSHKSSDYQQYIDFFEKVYKTFQDNYYVPVRRENYDRFIKTFDAKIYSQLKAGGKSDNYIRWRSAAYLVDYLKTEEDTFSKFFPPKFADNYKHEVLGQRIDLGIDGKLTGDGYLVTFVEPRSDAYEKGLREDDILTRIDDTPTLSLKQEEIVQKLTPLVDAKIRLAYLDRQDRQEKSMTVVSREYFKQTVFFVPVPVPGIFCLQIQRFDRMTSDDLFRYLQVIEKQNPRGLILDLRGNPGGPPLAAREISSFFLPGGSQFAYFKKRDDPQVWLDVPSIPEQYHYDGPLVILVNQDSGSASELFTGILQSRSRAYIMGTNTAGKVMLKSMFNFDDNSMVVMVTGLGYFPDGHRFSFKGVTPDHIVSTEEQGNLVNLAAAFLFTVSKKNVQ